MNRARRRPLGFGNTDQTAAFFRLPRREVVKRAESGEWPSYSIGGRRVFDLDEILDLSVSHREALDSAV